MTDFHIIPHELLCMILFYSVFRRAVHSCENVRTDVRFAFFLLGVIACGGMVAPLAWHFVPDLFALLLLLAVTLVQLVTDRYWMHGVPYHFYKPGYPPPRRRATDTQGGIHGPA